VRGGAVRRCCGRRLGWRSGRRVRRQWTGERPDVVSVATPGPLGWSAARAAFRLGVPVYSGYHTDFPGYARPYGAGWLEPIVTGYLPRFHNRTRGTIVPTRDVRDRLRVDRIHPLSLLGRGVETHLLPP